MNSVAALVKSVGAEALGAYLRFYHRHEITFDEKPLDRQVLIVANHGFGGVIDLNVQAMSAVLGMTGWSRPTTVLVHQIAWTLGLGGIIESLGDNLVGPRTPVLG